MIASLTLRRSGTALGSQSAGTRPPLVPLLIPHIFPSLPISPPLQSRPRPTRPPCVPFFRDPAHTQPTKRLYRQLLRATYRFPVPPASPDGPSSSTASPGRGKAGLAGIRLRAMRDWHRRRGNTSPSRTAQFLASQSSLLDIIRNTTPSSPSYPSLLSRDFALHLSHTRYLARLAYTAAARHQAALRPPHLTGGFLRPSALNPPLPRLRPQPIGLSMMMRNRVRAHERRVAARKEWAGYERDMAAEVAMWKGLGLVGESGRWLGSGWALGMKETLKRLELGWEAGNRRAKMCFKEGMRRRVGRARVRREAWARDRAEARKRAAVDGGEAKAGVDVDG